MAPKIRYTTREAQDALGISNSKYWLLVKEGRLRVYRDGNKGYVAAEELKRYDAECRTRNDLPAGSPLSAPGAKGVQKLTA